MILEGEGGVSQSKQQRDAFDTVHSLLLVYLAQALHNPPLKREKGIKSIGHKSYEWQFYKLLCIP